jgi:hypothetical protein
MTDGWRYWAWLTAHEPEQDRNPFADVGGLSRGPRKPVTRRPHPDCPACSPVPCARHAYPLRRSVA